MITDFANQGTEDIFNGVNSGVARRICPPEIHSLASRKLQELQAAGQLDDLRQVRGNRLQRLRGDRLGQYSIRINDQYRICFVWQPGLAAAVEITDYHRG